MRLRILGYEAKNPWISPYPIGHFQLFGESLRSVKLTSHLSPKGSVNCQVFPVVASLKLTAKAPENRPGPKRKLVLQPSIFRCKLAVSFREGSIFFGQVSLWMKLVTWAIEPDEGVSIWGILVPIACSYIGGWCHQPPGMSCFFDRYDMTSETKKA